MPNEKNRKLMQNRNMAKIKRIVQKMTKEEYQATLETYKEMPEEARFEAMVRDSDKIAFYRHYYIIIVIIGDLFPEDWIRLYLDHEEGGILDDLYRSYKAFCEDSEEDEEAEEEEDDDVPFPFDFAFKEDSFGGARA
ncbi:MAG: hypothetical protein WCR16_03960 [Bacilli bacterium]